MSDEGIMESLVDSIVAALVFFGFESSGVVRKSSVLLAIPARHC